MLADPEGKTRSASQHLHGGCCCLGGSQYPQEAPRRCLPPSLCLCCPAEHCQHVCWRQAVPRSPSSHQVQPRHAALSARLPGCPPSAWPAPGLQSSPRMRNPGAPAPLPAWHLCALWLTQDAAPAPRRHCLACFWPKGQRTGRHLPETAAPVLTLAGFSGPAAAY